MQQLFQLAKQALETVGSAIDTREKLPTVRRVKIYNVFNVKPVVDWPSLGKTTPREYVIGSRYRIMLSVINQG